MDSKYAKSLKFVFFILAFLGFIIFFIMGERDSRLSKRKFNNLSINGVVLDLKFNQLDRGSPSYYIDGKWANFGLSGQKVESYIKVSDSLFKESGSDTIQIYRKKEGGEWELIIER